MRDREPTLVERAVQIIGTGVYAALGAIIIGMVFWMFAAQNRALGQAVSIPEACRPLAALVGLPPAPTQEEAAAAIAELRKPEYDSFSAVRACREAIRPKRKPPRWRRGI